MPSERSLEVAVSTEHQLRSLKHKVGRYALYLQNFDQPLRLSGGHLQWYFWRWQRVISSKNDGARPWQLTLPSAAEHQSWSLKRKIGRYARYLRNFNRPLGLHSHLRKFFYVGNVSSVKKTTARVHGNCRCRQPWSISRHHLHFAISQNFHDFACSFCHLFFITPFCILHNTNTHH